MNHLRNLPPAVPALALVLVPLLVQLCFQWNAALLTDGTVIGVHDPDPWLRLTLVRDWLTGGSWYSHEMLHSNAPWGGIASPWTRPLDLVIAFFTQLQPDSVDLNIRLIRTSLLLPILWMTLLLLGLYRNVRIICPVPSAPLIVSVFVASSVPMWNYFSSGNSDHHSLLCVVFVWALAGVLTPKPSPRLVIITGFLLALQLWISPEALILIGILYGWYGLLWLKGDARVAPWALLATTIALGSALSLMIERPASLWFVPVYDSISIVYVTLLALVASAVWVLQRATLTSVTTRAMLAAGAMAIIAGVMLHSFPLIRKGPMAEVDPYIFSHFLPRIAEAEPVLFTPLANIAAMLVQPILAVLLLYLARRDRKAIFTPIHIAQLGYLVFCVGALFLTERRFCYYFQPVLTLVLAPFFATLYAPNAPAVRGLWPARLWAALPEKLQMERRLPLLLLAIGLPIIFIAMSPKETEQSRVINSCMNSSRRLIHSGELNRLMPKPLTLYLWTDLGGEILFFTPHRIVASNYHREGAGIRYVWEAQNITQLPELRRYLAERQVGALLLCPVVKPPADSVLQRLRVGTLHAPWLTPINYTLPAAAKPEEEAHKPTLFFVR